MTPSDHLVHCRLGEVYYTLGGEFISMYCVAFSPRALRVTAVGVLRRERETVVARAQCTVRRFCVCVCPTPLCVVRFTVSLACVTSSGMTCVLLFPLHRCYSGRRHFEEN